jgi:hypothetical protein
MLGLRMLETEQKMPGQRMRSPRMLGPRMLETEQKMPVIPPAV